MCILNINLTMVMQNQMDTYVKRGKLAFEVWDEKIEFILAKLLKNPSLRDSCCLVDLLSSCVQENTKLEESILDITRVEKEDTQAKGYEEALGEKYIPTK